MLWSKGIYSKTQTLQQLDNLNRELDKVSEHVWLECCRSTLQEAFSKYYSFCIGIIQRRQYCGQREHEFQRPVRDTEYKQFDSYQSIFADYGHSLAGKYNVNSQRIHGMGQYDLSEHCDCGSSQC